MSNQVVSSAYGGVGAAGASVYVATKHAVAGQTESAALEVAATGVHYGYGRRAFG